MNWKVWDVAIVISAVSNFVPNFTFTCQSVLDTIRPCTPRDILRLSARRARRGSIARAT